MASSARRLRRACLTDAEIGNILETLDDSEGELSEEELGDSDNEYDGNADQPPSDESSTSESSTDEDEEGSNAAVQSSCSLNAAPRAQWRRRKQFSPQEETIHQPTLPPNDRQDFNFMDYFKQYIDDDILQVIVDKTNQTYVVKYGRSLNLNLTELKTFLGASIIMSCLQYPMIRMYWNKRWNVPIISNSISRNRYFAIRTVLKVVFDEDISGDERKKDRLWKLRPLIEKIRETCLKQERVKNLCVDEMMVPFSGVCSLKQYVPNKPNPVGLKAFVLADPCGIVLDFTFYQGETTYPEYVKQGFGLGESAFIQLTESLTPGHIIYHDRYFTSLKLVDSLLNRGFLSTGTICQNRLPKNITLKTGRELMKIGRGSCEMLVRFDDKVAIVKWMDRKGITMLSSAEGVAPLGTCKRYNKREKKYENISRPDVVTKYNLNMGGVDLFGRMLSYCPMRARTKKWTIRTIFHLFDMCVANAWLQLRKDKSQAGCPRKSIPQLRMYKLALGEMLIHDKSGISVENESNHESDSDDEIEVETVETVSKKRKLPVPLPADGKRKTGVHMPEIEEVKDWQKCRRPGCQKKTRTMCSTCNIFLCLLPGRNCYKIYHQQ